MNYFSQDLRWTFESSIAIFSYSFADRYEMSIDIVVGCLCLYNDEDFIPLDWVISYIDTNTQGQSYRNELKIR